MEDKNLFSESGILITLFLIVIPVIVASIIVVVKAYAFLNNYNKKKELDKFNEYLKGLQPEEIQKLEIRKKELEFVLANNELAGTAKPSDNKGLIDNLSTAEELRFVEKKKKGQPHMHHRESTCLPVLTASWST